LKECIHQNYKLNFLTQKTITKMSEQNSNFGDWKPNITPCKTRQEMQDEYDMPYPVFTRKLKFHKIELPPGCITPKYQIMIYEAFGVPPPKEPKNRKDKKQ
jgi:hypothetical protein